MTFHIKYWSNRYGRSLRMLQLQKFFGWFSFHVRRLSLCEQTISAHPPPRNLGWGYSCDRHSSVPVTASSVLQYARTGSKIVHSLPQILIFQLDTYLLFSVRHNLIFKSLNSNYPRIEIFFRRNIWFHHDVLLSQWVHVQQRRATILILFDRWNQYFECIARIEYIVRFVLQCNVDLMYLF